MNLHNKYSYGQLFCFSGIDGQTSRANDLVAMFLDEPVTLRFHFNIDNETVTTVTLKLPLENANFQAVTGDLLVGDDLIVAFASHKVILGKSPVMPLVLSDLEANVTTANNKQKIVTSFGVYYLVTEKREDGYYFAFSYSDEVNEAPTLEQLLAIKEERYAYFEAMPKCPDEKYEKLYYKCLSINKENVYSPEGKIPYRWTTPDRVPHRYMWLWDSVFHAFAFAEYNVQMAKESILSVLCMQDESGFIAHMYDHNGPRSEITQPQVLAWGVWTVYQRDKDKEFLKKCVPHLKKFLIWTAENRDNNNNGLLEWFTEPNYIGCRCGESGLDNSPRFDFDVEMDAIDFSIYLCNDARYLHLIYNELGDKENADYFLALHQNIKDKINNLLWCEEDGLYYDRLFNGNLTKVASPSSFLPMFAGICSQEQADKMVKVLLDESRFWTETPIPSMPKDSEFYDIDMWRGCSWLNINYFIMQGLKKYGYHDIASKLREKTLNAILKWYNETGNVFEFYDADNNISPLFLKRKGEQPSKPDYLVHVHSITDYNWSACFTLLFILNIDN